MPRKKKPYTYFKNGDVTYVYANEDVFNEETQKVERKRHMIGKLDPVTGEIVPTAGRGGWHGRKKEKEVKETTAKPEQAAKQQEKDAFTAYRQESEAKIRKMQLTIDRLTVELEEEKRRNQKLLQAVLEFTQKVTDITERGNG